MKKLQNKGFTIIEVVLVLAIAGLIFVIVFLAVPQLQASRRDTQRRNDVGRVIAALQDYAGNNNGRYPADFDDFGARYLDNITLEDPSTDSYQLEQNWDDADEPTAVGNMVVNIGATCDGESFGGGSNRDVAVMVALDDGDTRFCQDVR